MNKQSINIFILLLTVLLAACSSDDTPEVKPIIKGQEKTVAVGYEAGSIAMAIQQTEGYDIRVSEGAEDWLSCDVSSDYNTITINYKANEGLSREGQIILTKRDVMWIFTVSQDLNPTAGPHDIQLPFEKAGEMYGMIIYGFQPSDVAKIPVGDKVVFDFTNNAGTFTIFDGTTHNVLLAEKPSGKRVVVEWTEALKACNLAARINDLTNPLVSVHYTNQELDQPVDLNVDFGEPANMYGMLIYSFGAGAFAEAQTGDEVVFEFTNSNGNFTMTDSSNQPLATGALEQNRFTTEWTEAMQKADGGGIRCRINDTGNPLVRITINKK